MNGDRPKLAVFFDAENVSLQYAAPILRELFSEWEIHLRRAYGSNVIAQQEVLRELSIVPVEVLRNINTKNAADLTLAVDAMEELCLGFSDGICIVSGDSDFTRLVQRIRERGKSAIVYGNANTPASLRNACTAFHLVGVKQVKSKSPKPPAKPKAVPKQARSGKADAKQSPNGSLKFKSAKTAADLQNMDAKTIASLRQNLRRAFQEYQAKSGGNSLGEFGNFIRQTHPKLHQRNFGFAHLRPLLTKLGGFHFEAVRGERGSISGYRLSLLKEPRQKTA
ncbi:NYN domain-containing protein [Occallatibacter riparius]|uniref:NYN domain-containing protein n=1 Tax=Occallatibacter riparius TaxID=1002689 RepID=A0A9J7BQB7_9BACT|nr:NYN domain-containing protein [Occallatibacter riparius]UWZ84987.1 NYN domain-containing protein [Occallatibacter riparius]